MEEHSPSKNLATSTLSLRPSLSLFLSKNSIGASHLLEYLAFKATQHRTHFRLVREVSSSFFEVSGERRKIERESGNEKNRKTERRLMLK